MLRSLVDPSPWVSPTWRPSWVWDSPPAFPSSWQDAFSSVITELARIRIVTTALGAIVVLLLVILVVRGRR